MKQLLVVLLSLFAFVPSDAQETISLSGFWEYSLADSAGYAGEVTLPGVLPVKGDRISLRHSVYVPGTSSSIWSVRCLRRMSMSMAIR